ncbi:MAG: hypothetical protein ACFB01_00010 [Cohaesibacteraceae bacterium]
MNLAARVEAKPATLAEPVLITGETLSAAKPHDATLEGGFTSAGDHSVKGRRQPVTVFRLISND